MCKSRLTVQVVICYIGQLGEEYLLRRAVLGKMAPDNSVFSHNPYCLTGLFQLGSQLSQFFGRDSVFVEEIVIIKGETGWQCYRHTTSSF